MSDIDKLQWKIQKLRAERAILSKCLRYWMRKFNKADLARMDLESEVQALEEALEGRRLVSGDANDKDSQSTVSGSGISGPITSIKSTEVSHQGDEY